MHSERRHAYICIILRYIILYIIYTCSHHVLRQTRRDRAMDVCSFGILGEKWIHVLCRLDGAWEVQRKAYIYIYLYIYMDDNFYINIYSGWSAHFSFSLFLGVKGYMHGCLSFLIFFLNLEIRW